ncbi:efflux RND transporter permease subunit [Pseudoteredinibacter isoporae]|uniref:efflux RND transporter permease subunit n=1 Tax=Pseudoteredinibacter isoporae TaxID=570281 RepID=UPI003106C560
MKFLDVAVGRFRSTLCVLFLIVLVGMFSREKMAVEMQPDVSLPFVIVSVFQEGISPEDGARLLLRPLEQELRTLEGLEELSGTARESTAYILVEFESDKDIKLAVTEVREAVDRAKAKLPTEAEEPVVEEASASDFPAIVVTFRGDVSERTLFKTAQNLKRQFEGLPDILEANMVGHREEVVEVIINPDQLEHYGITSTELINAVIGNNLLVPAGELDSSQGRFAIKVPGLIETAQDVYGIPIKSTADGVVTLGEVTDIRRTFKDPSRFTSVNGQSAIAVEVTKRRDANQIAVTRKVQAIVNENAANIPKGVTVEYILDQSEFALGMIGEMEGNIVTAMLLVMVIVVAALGFRSGLLVGLGIPFSLLFAIIIISYMGYTFNFMVMFGMLLALGMLIDGAIVITEFADRKMAEGLSAKAAYQISVKRMFWPVVASTATTLAAFLPLMFWPGVAGEFMGYLPTTVFAVLTGSLLYALLFAPVLGSLMGRSEMEQDVQQYLRKLETESPTKVAGVTGAYARLLTTLLRRPVVMFGVSLFTLIVIFMAYGAGNAGVEFFTETEEKYGQVAVRAQGNLSVEEVRDIVQEVERRVIATPGVVSTYSASGSGGTQGGGARPPEKDQVGTLLVELDDPQKLTKRTREVFADINKNTKDIPGVLVSANAFEGGPPVGKPIQIQIASHNHDKLVATARRIHHALDTEFEGLRDVTDTTPLPGIEWELKVDRSLAAQMGANIVEVGRAVQLVTNGVKVGEYRPDDADEEVDIRVRYPDAERGMMALDDLRVNTHSGSTPISSFVSREAQPKVDKVKRVDGIEIMMVRADVQPGVLADNKVKEIEAWLAEQPRDSEVKVEFRGANEEQNNSAAFLSVAFSLALFLMFVLLVTQFNSFYQGILILSAVIMSTAGVMLGLLITQQTFSVILTGVGIVALAGIVVNNNIVLIDTYNHVRQQDSELTPAEAVVRACAQRLRPVFLTTVTTVLGLLPIALGTSVDFVGREIVSGGVIASFFVPLASAVVYGLVFSTILTLVVTPVLLVLPQRIVYLFRRYVLPSGRKGQAA